MLVQNRVALAEPKLPEVVRRLGVSTVKSNPDALLVVHLYSPDKSRDQLFISNYVRIQMRDELRRIKGVGQILEFGFREYSLRMWLDTQKMAAFNVSHSDVIKALRSQNIDVASGALNVLPGEQAGALEVRLLAESHPKDVTEFENIVLKVADAGRSLKVKDIARVELGAKDYSSAARLDYNPAVALMFNQEPGTNAIETAEAIKEKMSVLATEFPDGVAYDIIWNPTEFVENSVHEVNKTILEAVVLVSLVVYLFLQTFRASLIPIIAIPISLVGTFAIMKLFGFSLNNLSLFGLVLAVGIVVDDAIIVVENVERRIREGLAPKKASLVSMEEIGGALIAVSLVLVAVFIPTAFLEGITGEFYRQFAVTVSAATLISAAVSLTLSPALAALLLRHNSHKTNWFFTVFNKIFDRLSIRYANSVYWMIRKVFFVLVIYSLLIVTTGVHFISAPKGFVPTLDQNYLITVIQLPPGATLSRTERVVDKVIEEGLKNNYIAHAAAFSGFEGATRTLASNAATVFFTMKDIGPRTAAGGDMNKIIAQLRSTFSQLQNARVLVIPPPPIRGIGNAGGVKGYVQDKTGEGSTALSEQVASTLTLLRGNERIGRSFSTFNTDSLQLKISVDKDKAGYLGVDIADVFSTLQSFFGSYYVNDFDAFGKRFQLNIQADSNNRDSVEDLLETRVRNSSGGMVPLANLLNIEYQKGPSRVARYNLFPAAAIQATPADNISSGSAIETIENELKRLPNNFGFEWTELALQEKLSGSSTGTLILAVCFVFLILAAQYESLSMPLAVILTVPLSILATLIGVALKGIEVNILVQISIVVLIALSAKNAILIVEFAKQKVEMGSSATEAAVLAAKLRLRPILMTSFSFILGVLPLMLATGAGYEMRQSIGTAMFSGMLGVTIFGLLLTPVLFVVVDKVANKFGKKNSQDCSESIPN